MHIVKRGLVLVVLVLLLSLTACASGTGAASPTATNASATATTAPQPTDTATPAGPTIEMAVTSFTGTKSITVKAGQAVTFDDPTDGGGVHHLVTGTGGVFQAVKGAPNEFATSDGMAFGPGTTVSIVFPTAGTFPITCTIHPSMQATITVTS